MELTSFDRLRVAEDEHGYDAKSDYQKRFFRNGKAGGWRDALSAEQAARIEVDHGVVMRECGYL
jgi:aryl sulfotransferase